MKKNLIFGIVLVFILLLIGCLFLKDKEIQELEKDLNDLKNNEIEQNDKTSKDETTSLTEEELKLHIGAWVTEKQQMTINKISHANNSITISNIKVNVENNNVKIDNTTKGIENDSINKVTGYFEQSADLIHIYVLTENKNVYKLSYSKTNGLTNETFKKINIDNVDDLVLADVTIIQDEIGETPEKYRIYVIKGKEVLLINEYE